MEARVEGLLFFKNPFLKNAIIPHGNGNDIYCIKP
jgi:hypothetical protein